ncbi:MAG: single-stranded DNA-binding protein, partial [Candidatus Paceibacteria bacterium]
MNLNKAYILGRVTQDPELKTLPSGSSVTSFGIATNRVWKDKEGNRQESTEFHNIVAFNRQAEVINQYAQKGTLLLVEGRLQTRSWEGQDGQKRYKTEIVAEQFQLGPKGQQQRAGVGYQQQSSNTQNQGSQQQSGGQQTNEGMPTINEYKDGTGFYIR